MEIKGKVINGIQQAREMLGIKTANIETIDAPTEKGVFAARLELAGQQYQGISFLGKAHLVKGAPQRIEVFLFDYQGPEFYGEQVVLSLEKKLRDAEKFKSEEQAKTMIAGDIKLAKEYFKKE